METKDIRTLNPVETDKSRLEGKAILVHDPETGEPFVFDATLVGGGITPEQEALINQIPDKVEQTDFEQYQDAVDENFRDTRERINTLEDTMPDKANDSEVVHKTGDETINNKKTWSGTQEYNRQNRYVNEGSIKFNNSAKFTRIIASDGHTLQEDLDSKADVADLDDIKEVIPSQASADNQLADKEFVNSSIATNTANFIGTFNSVEELEAQPTEDLTNNDYAFVATDGEYKRYKWNTESWLYEYTLNNSSFTQSQWDTINSGLTGNDATALRSTLTLLGNIVPDDASATNKLATRAFLEARHITLPLLTLQATQEQLEGVFNSISNAPSGSAFFIALDEGRGVMPVAVAIGANSVFAQYADGRYSHELKISLVGDVYVFEKTDKVFATATDLANYYTKTQIDTLLNDRVDEDFVYEEIGKVHGAIQLTASSNDWNINVPDASVLEELVSKQYKFLDVFIGNDDLQEQVSFHNCQLVISVDDENRYIYIESTIVSEMQQVTVSIDFNTESGEWSGGGSVTFTPLVDESQAISLANDAIADALDEDAQGAIIEAIKAHHDTTKQDTLTPGSGITIEDNVISSSGISDAPSDGKQYARQNGAWSEVQGMGEWELIEQSTIEGGTTQIERTQTPDGVPYDYKALMVCLRNGGINFTSANIRVQIDDIGYLTSIQGNNSNSNLYKVSFERIRGIWESRAIFSNANGVERMTYFNGSVPPHSTNGQIRKFSISYANTAGFAEGAQLYIYAIK